MSTPVEKCFELRDRTASIIGETIQLSRGRSEVEIARLIGSGIANLPETMATGWYDPPPGGIAVLFGSPEDDFERTRFGTLRSDEFWPSKDITLGEETVGIFYASPVSAEGIIGDWGATLYSGRDDKIQRHLASCLMTVEDLAEFVETEMEFGDVSRQADLLLSQRQLTTDRTVLINAGDAAGTNCGHTVPFTSRRPNIVEAAVLESNNSQAIAKLISNNRVFVNTSEKTRIPGDGAFTVELRLESLDDPTMPNAFFHLIAGMQEGHKTVRSNLNPFFDAVGMNYLRSRF